MQERKSYYNLALYAIIASLLAVIAWQFISTQRQRTKESELVEKYRPTMQRICDDLGVKIQIHNFADLLNAYEQITTKAARSDSLDQ